MPMTRRTSFRLRWQFLRARLSIPALLSSMDERKVVTTVAALDGAVALLVISVAAWLSGLPLLFPSLGPSAYILYSRPFSPAAAPRSVILGHSLGIACGWFSCVTMTFLFGHSFSLVNPSLALCLSADLAFVLSCLLMMRLSCVHPPAFSTALIVACGGITGWPNLLVMAAAAVLLAYQGVIVHRLFGVHAPLWKVDPNHVEAIKARGLAA